MRFMKQMYVLAELYAHLRMPLHELMVLQEKLLRKTVRRAYYETRFYRNKMKSAGVHPDDVRTVEDLQKVPTTTKEEILSTPLHEMLSVRTDLRKCHISKTSGSTGTNMTVVYDNRSYDHERALSIRANLACGQRFNDRQLTIDRPNDTPVALKWFQRLGLFPITHMSVFAPPEKAIEKLNYHRPHVIYGFASYLWVVARHINEHGGLAYRPRIVFSTAEVLDEEMREDMRKAFDCEILDQFGCVEMGRTAWECPTHQGYHMDVDSFVFEFLHDAEPVSPGSEGEVVYTNLYNSSMPLIRYAIGDIAVPSGEPCSCGRTFPLIRMLLGRKDDYLVLPDGSLLPPIEFAVMMKRKAGVLKYRVVQENVGTLIVLVKTGNDYTKETAKAIENEAKAMMGRELKVVIQEVDEIPPDRTGKMRSVVSMVPKPW